MYISSLEVTCLPASVFLKLLFPCVPHSKLCMYTVVSRLVETRCLVCRVRCTFNLPLMLGFVYSHLPSCLPLGSYVAMVCGVTCHRAQQQQHCVATQLYESDAPLVRVVEPTEHESSRANLLRPCRVVSKGHHAFDTGWGRQWTRLSGDQ
jgi:hypothetical protein